MTPTRRRHRPYRRQTADRTYIEATHDQLAEAVAAFYLGLLKRGVPEKRARSLASQHLFLLVPGRGEG